MESQEVIYETVMLGNDQFDTIQPEALGDTESAHLRNDLATERDRHLRVLAEFDNYRRRTRKELAGAKNEGKRELLLAMLEVMDDFERALDHVKGSEGSIADGLRLIHQRFQSLLQVNLVTPFVSKGQPFDPTIHEATSVVEAGADEAETVHEEVLRGYEWNGELLRPAQVIVVR